MNEMDVKNNEPIFVIGFPKSGNTWLARLLAEITQSNIVVNSPLDAVNAADNSPDRKGRYLIHKKHVVEDVENVLQCKTVYIIRDVRDVLVSGFFHCNRWCEHNSIKRNVIYGWYFNHEVKKLNKMWQGNIWAELYGIRRYGIRRFIKSLIRRKYNITRVGNWSDHVTYWTQFPSVVVVRYEDLLRETEVALKIILDALKIDVDDETLMETVSNQSFERKKSEFLRSGNSQNFQFLRSGETGGWKELLSPAIVKKIEIKHAHVMNEYKYKSAYYEGKI